MSSIQEMRDMFPRVAGISTFDLGGTMLLTIPYARYTEQPYSTALIKVLVVGEVIHLILGQSTAITRLL
jgi:hypothetical protein